jgi:hypothetical protein
LFKNYNYSELNNKNINIDVNKKIELIQLIQIYILCKFLEIIVNKKEFQNIPIVCCGDFGFDKSSNPYKFINTGNFLNLQHKINFKGFLFLICFFF